MPHHTITVDDEVFARLQREAEPFVDDPNSVLRRLLQLDDGGHSRRRQKPALERLLAVGLLTPGQRLRWHRRNLGNDHVAFVHHDGRIRLEDGRICSSPSGACDAVASVSVNGWDVWYTDDGISLGTLRAGMAPH
ncbi:hypothetical protein ABZ729_18955 [Streptomyces sp. NPDC006678]|uniref:restriction system modified-DNA reader domain-containing protein n=1 Tax=Streptomyces sp. NPDC006678 TaxID=3157185 RepID=UPI0033C946D9